MISSLQSSKKLMKGTYFYLQIGPNALIFAQFDVLIIRTMAVPPLQFISRQYDETDTAEEKIHKCVQVCLHVVQDDKIRASISLSQVCESTHPDRERERVWKGFTTFREGLLFL